MNKRKQRNHRGQFQSPRTLANLYLLLGFMLTGMYLEWYYRPVELLNPLVSVKTVEAREIEPRQSPSPTTIQAVEPTTEPPSDIKGYIDYKFGEDAWKAHKLLTGEGCGENRNYDPHAINDNTAWGGVGKDRGYWQINDVYHPHVSDWCASDVKCSTDYAYRMYLNDNKSFKRWTCGRVHGL